MTTDFSYGDKTINSLGPIKPSGTNQPLDPRTEVKLYADIETIPNPYVGMIITVLEDETNQNKMTDYKVLSLKANALGIANSVIDRVQKYSDYLGVSGGSSGDGLTSEQAQQLQTAYEHSRSPHINTTDVNNAVSAYVTEHKSELKGDKGDTGATGADGVKGQDGITPTLRVGSVTTLEAGNNATVTISESNNEYTLNFGIPKGAKGDTGASGSGGSSSVANSEWSGKVASFLGDSITYGAKTTKIYHQYLKELVGFSTCNNYGIDGASITNHSNGICTRYNNVASDSDIIFIFGGTNDFYYNKPLGEWYTLSGTTRTLNKDMTTFRGALATICDGLITKFPTKQIILMTPIHRDRLRNQQTDLEANASGLYLDDYVECVKEAGKIFGIPVIDLNGESGLYPMNTENANAYFHADDKLHPNANGHLKIAKVIQGKLRTILPLDINYTPNVYGEIVLSKTSITMDEGASNTFTVKLDKAPTNSQVVNISVNNTDVTLSNSTLTFTSSNYNQAQEVTINTTEDSDTANDNCTLTLSSNNVSSKTIAITITDNDTPSETYGNIIVSKTTVSIDEGNSETFTVKLDKAPTNSQTVNISSNNSDVTLSPKTLTFTSSNYNQAQEVTINTTEDSDKTNDTCTITLSSNGVADKTVTLTINDVTIDEPSSGGTDLTGKSYKLTFNGNQRGYNHVVFSIAKDEDYVVGGTLKMKFDINNATNFPGTCNVNNIQIYTAASPEVNNTDFNGTCTDMVTHNTTFIDGSASVDFNYTLKATNAAYLKVTYGLRPKSSPASIDISNISVTINGKSKPILAVGAFFASENCVVSEL